MKIVTFEYGGTTSAGFLDGDLIVVCGEGPGAVQSLIEKGSAGIAAWYKAGDNGAPRVPLADVTLLSPIPEPRRDVFCVGKNYHAHAEEFHSSGFDSSGKEAVPSAPAPWLTRVVPILSAMMARLSRV